tara:strand:- start:843 stop:1379 length:537 start_codon:yes stop_codon:yes gene_type:complete
MKIKIILLFLFIPLIGRDLYFTRSGKVSFFSSTPIYDISAVNNQMTCVLDLETGSVSFRIPILGFNFPNGLMQEHFNENYMESDLYPNASFKGKINDWSKLKLSDKPQEVILNGTMTIHGVSNVVSEKGKISMKNNDLIGSSNFLIAVADYNIQIPKLVRDKIAKIVSVDTELILKKK